MISLSSLVLRMFVDSRTYSEARAGRNAKVRAANSLRHAAQHHESFMVPTAYRRFERSTRRWSEAAALRQWQSLTLVHRNVRLSLESGATFVALQRLGRGLSLWRKTVSLAPKWCRILIYFISMLLLPNKRHAQVVDCRHYEPAIIQIRKVHNARPIQRQRGKCHADNLPKCITDVILALSAPCNAFLPHISSQNRPSWQLRDTRQLEPWRRPRPRLQIFQAFKIE